MPKNTKKGANKNKKQNVNSLKTKRALVLKNDIGKDTAYGQVTKLLGSCHFTVSLLGQNKSFCCRICGSIKKKQKILVDSIVVVGIRDYQEDKGDIAYVYLHDEIHDLKELKEIPMNLNAPGDEEESEKEEIEFDFDEI